jgi:two-component system phosphate regulon sensor histidine kinase PhoR
LTSLIENLFYRKFKLLYKIISSTKESYKEENIRDTIEQNINVGQIEKDIETWIEERQSQPVLNDDKSFLLNLSHEIKTPLFAAQGFINILNDNQSLSEAQRVKFLQNAKNAVERINNFITSLSDLNLVQHTEHDLRKSNFVIQQAITQIIEEMSLIAAEQEMQICIKDGCESPITVHADKEKILRVLSNLVSNSVKFGKYLGLIQIGIYNVDNSSVLIEVTDNGIGIEESHIQHIFDRLYRVDIARSRDSGGAGLGLSIAKEIIELHGHHIQCRSKIGVGTTIGFTLSIGH